MHDATGGAGFVRPDLTAFCRLDELGVEVTGQYLDSERAVLACRITDEDRWCRRCGEQGAVRDTVTRRLAHWCTILVSVILDGLPMHPRRRWVIALLA
ncbi:Transposase (fragment) [Mycobacterium canettii CIPT 140070008]